MTEQTTPILSVNPIPKRRFNPKDFACRIFAIGFAVATMVAIFYFAPYIREFSKLSYLGVFLINLIACASIVVPIPGLGVTFVMAATGLNWLLVGLASGAGQTLGETTGYMAGYGGGFVLENQPGYERLQYWMKNYGFLTLFVLSIIPNPLIDLAGITAGALGYPYYKFLLALWLGKTLKSIIFAWAGAHSMTWVVPYL